MEGDVVISSSRSGEGEAFRFLEGAVPDTEVAVSLWKIVLWEVTTHLIFQGRDGCVRGNEGESAA